MIYSVVADLLRIAHLAFLGSVLFGGLLAIRWRGAAWIHLPTAARYLWALPNTLVGLVFAAAAWRGGSVRVVGGVLEVHGPLVAAMLRRLTPLGRGAVAITFGHLVAAPSRELLDATRAHERVHVRQCERWGPFFIPAYLLASAWSWLRGRGAYSGNYFERQARDQASAKDAPRHPSSPRRTAGDDDDGTLEVSK